jgi:RND family efflux transporter MFP subunit
MIAAAFVLAAVISISAFTAREPASVVEALPEAALPRVRTATVHPAPAAVNERFSGHVRSADRSAVGFTLSGRVKSIAVSTGQRVSEGAVLAQLDTEPFENALAEARAREEDVASQLRQAGRDLERARALGRGVTEAELEQRRTAVERLEAQHSRARAAVSEAMRRLREATLTAPYAGEVVGLFADTGEVVGAGAPVALLSSADGGLEVKLFLPERVAFGISVGTAVEMSYPLSPQLGTHEGRLVARAEHAAEGSGLFEATIAFSAEARRAGVRPGVTVTVALPVSLSDDLRAVPPAAISGGVDGGAVVYAVSSDRVREEPVVVRGVWDQRVLVIGGISAGEEVIVSGHYALLDGDEVEVAR